MLADDDVSISGSDKELAFSEDDNAFASRTSTIATYRCDCATTCLPRGGSTIAKAVTTTTTARLVSASEGF